jgi:hypothetical protein
MSGLRRDSSDALTRENRRTAFRSRIGESEGRDLTAGYAPRQIKARSSTPRDHAVEFFCDSLSVDVSHTA